MNPKFLKVQPGSHLSASEWNKITRYIRRLCRVTGTGNVRVSTGPAGIHVHGLDVSLVVFPAKITDNASGSYSWTEQQPKSTGGGGKADWEDEVGPREGVKSTATAAYELNGAEDVPNDTLVTLCEIVRSNGTPAYFFSFVVVSSFGGSRMCLIVSYQSGTTSYTVQPVAWSGSAWVNDGSQITGVVNVGEVQTGEGGYLSGPGGEDIYVRLYEENGDWFLAVHPPRMP